MQSNNNKFGEKGKQYARQFIDGVTPHLRKFLLGLGAYSDSDWDGDSAKTAEIPQITAANPTGRRQIRLASKENQKRKARVFGTESERKKFRRNQHRQKAKRHLTKLRTKYWLRPCPREIPLSTWIMTHDIIADPTDKAALWYLKNCGNRTLVARIRSAASIYRDGKQIENFSRLRARCIIALGLALNTLGKRWGREIEVLGIPQAALLKLIENPYEPYSDDNPLDYDREKHRLSGVHRKNARALGLNGQTGYLKALKEHGAVRSEQMTISDALSTENWGTHALNRYYLPALGYIPPIPQITVADMVLLEANSVRKNNIFPQFSRGTQGQLTPGEIPPIFDG